MTVISVSVFQISTSVLHQATHALLLLTLFAIIQMDRLFVNAKTGLRRMALFVKVKHKITFIANGVYNFC